MSGVSNQSVSFMFDSLKRRFKRSGREDSSGLAAEGAPETTAVTLAVPNLLGGAPICRATVRLTTTRAGRGENWRLQAHVETCLRPPAHIPADRQLPPAEGVRGLVHRGQAVANQLADRGVSMLPARLRPLLEQRVHTWLDLRGSNLPLVQGARALMPEPLKEIHDSLPAPRPGEPRVLAWEGMVGGEYPGFARFVSLQVDQDDFPAGSLGDVPFSLSASGASIVQSSAQRPPDREDN